MRRRVAVATLLAPVLTAGVASAHEVGTGRFESPLPLSLLLLGGAITVAATAAWLGVAGEGSAAGASADAAGTRTTRPLSSRTVAAVRPVARVAMLALVVVALGHGLLGPDARAANAATLLVWPVWFKGLALAAALVGNHWPTLSPWETCYDGLAWLEGGELGHRDYPAWLGEWPALLGFLAVVGVVENLTLVTSMPAATAGLVAVYGLVTLLGGVVFGREWFRRADFLAVLYRLFARVAPLRVRDGEIELRAPWTGCTDPVRSLASAAFVVAAVYTVTFDGFVGTPEFQTAFVGLRRATGLGDVVAVGLYLAGYAGFAAVFLGVSAAVASRSPGAGSGPEMGTSTGSAVSAASAASTRSAALAYAPTVIPIAVAYEVAHNYPFVVDGLASLATVATGVGVDPLGWLSLPLFWGSQVVLVVVGHLVAVVAAHRVALARTPTLGAARRAHGPLVALMVGYTVLSLWVVSRPVVA